MLTKIPIWDITVRWILSFNSFNWGLKSAISSGLVFKVPVLKLRGDVQSGRILNGTLRDTQGQSSHQVRGSHSKTLKDVRECPVNFFDNLECPWVSGHFEWRWVSLSVWSVLGRRLAFLSDDLECPWMSWVFACVLAQTCLSVFKSPRVFAQCS